MYQIQSLFLVGYSPRNSLNDSLSSVSRMTNLLFKLHNTCYSTSFRLISRIYNYKTVY